MSMVDYTEHRRASDISPFDIAAMSASVVSVAGAMIAAAVVKPELMAGSAVVGLLAAVSKVLSTRAKVGPAHSGPSDRDRRVRDGARQRSQIAL